MEGFKIFIVEDDSWYADILEYHLLLNPDFTVEKFSNGKDCLQNLYQKPQLITLDYSLPDMKGRDVLLRIKESHPDMPVIMISGQEDITTAVELLKEGAYDYIVKNEDTKDRLWNSIRLLREHMQLKEENIQLKEEIGKKYVFSNIIKGESAQVKQLFSLMEKAANSAITVSITGETGSGKELVAKSIHYNSDRKKQAFVPINISSIPKELVESELFGHEKGAFTGAIARRIGKLEEAHKGTLFLDEIAEMDSNIQVKLLRILQERELTRVGSNKAIPIDIRLITATHKNLADEVKSGIFRKDFYYRILGLAIKLPSLRERGDDILILSRYFADEYCKENKQPLVRFSADAQKKLLKYSYPGNIRELKAVIELAIIMSGESEILAEHITFSSLESISDFLLEETTLEQYMVQIVKYFLEKNNNNAITVAKKLGVGKSTIYRMIKKHNL